MHSKMSAKLQNYYCTHMNDQVPSIIIDTGTYMTKSGYTLDATPLNTIRTVIKRPNKSPNCPIFKRIIQDWDDMEAIWKHVITNELEVVSKEHSFLMTTYPIISDDDLQKIGEIMVEQFEVPNFCLENQAFLALYSAGKTSGVVIDVGAEITNVVPIHGGNIVKDSIRTLEIGGYDVTRQLEKMILEKNRVDLSFTMVDKMKQSLGYVAMDYIKESKRDSDDIQEIYQLPDGKTINIGQERFKCAEILWDPSAMGRNGPGVHDLTLNALSMCPENQISELAGNILLSGSTPMLKGFKKRLHEELLKGSSHQPKLLMPKDPYGNFSPSDTGTWRGGAMLTQRSDFIQNYCVAKYDFYEFGPRSVHMRGSKE